MERPKQTSPGGPASAGGVALLIVGLLTLVTLAAGGDSPISHGRLAARPVPNGVQDSWITLLTIAYAVTIIGVLVTMFQRRRRWTDPHTQWLRKYVTLLALMLVITGVGYATVRHGNLGERSQALLRLRGQQGQTSGSRSVGGGQPLPPRHAHFQWPLVLALGGAVLLGGAYVAVRRKRRPLHGAPDGETVEDELARAIGSTIDDLRGERDARRAVIAAYANMERILAAHDLERHRAEVPYEYLARVLQLLSVRESAARELTELFEYAKFSDHDVDPTMKERAIASLVMVKDDLQSTPELAA